MLYAVSSMNVPVSEIVAVCREYDVAEVLVDGAHVPGSPTN